jgi:hypothetical protein
MKGMKEEVEELPKMEEQVMEEEPVGGMEGAHRLG